MIKNNKVHTAVIIALGLTLSACGGSGSESEPKKIEPVNLAPTIALEGQTINEKETTSISATASDSDGSIASYKWKEVSQFDLTLSDSDTNSVTFTAPETYENKQAELELTVTDNDGATTSKKVLIDINQLTLSTTIEGRVSHEALYKGDIVISASGIADKFTTTVDDTGFYRATITVDDSQEDSFIDVTAKGTGDNSIAAYKSLLGSMSLLREKADNDEILTTDEYFAVNISNITTANYGLLKVQNDHNDILTDEEFTLRKLQVSNESVLTLATVIDLAINAKTGVAVQKAPKSKISSARTISKNTTKNNNGSDETNTDLPADINDTLELVSDIEQAKDYVSSVQGSDEYTQTQQAVLSNDNLKDSSTYKIPNNYHLLPTNTLVQSLGSIQFNDDGSGIWFNTITKTIKQTQSIFTWSESGGVITVTLHSPEIISTRPVVEIDGVRQRIDLNTSVLSYEIKRHSSHGTFDDLVITQHRLNHYPNGEFSDENIIESKKHTALKDTKQLPANKNTITTAYLTLPFEQQSTVSIYADKFTFNEDGSGSSKVLVKDFTWQKEANELTLSFNDNSKIIVEQVNTKNSVASHLMVKHIDVSGNIISKTVGEGNVISEAAAWTNDNIVGVYKYDNAIFDSPLDQFWIELNTDNTALTVSLRDKDENGTISSDEITKFTGDWQVNSDGTLNVTRYKDKQTGSVSPECNSDNTGCYVFNTRTWNLIANSNDQYLLFQHHQFGDQYQNNEVYSFDQQQWDIRTIHKITERPVTID
jgi:hypothetical protein